MFPLISLRLVDSSMVIEDEHPQLGFGTEVYTEHGTQIDQIRGSTKTASTSPLEPASRG
ncbi:Rubredoxin family protein [Natrarchaeobaculum sulfurireducens]|uniref:Rubredoxin family protein n=1 Tax=Natrarchaeobaculum sulfurireducens TaxID=2044521 RepID=A0A346PKQ8_9EURY|nr:Rubredoxin family protein [Natrarchaeobaculum sulfurireducens]AXR80103.1 Rubredoxin family protein [Natrarchaeobaculum sulfurireducens]